MSDSLEKSKDLIIRALNEGSIHGLGSLYRTKRILFQVIWVAFIAFATFETFRSVLISIIQYYDYDVVSDISTFTNFTFEFPSVTICSEDWNLHKEEMVIDCNAFGSGCDDNRFSYKNYYGSLSCFTFNTSQLVYFLTTQTLDMTLYTGRNLNGEGGLRLIVHNSSHYEKYNGEGFDVPSGNFFSIVLNLLTKFKKRAINVIFEKKKD